MQTILKRQARIIQQPLASTSDWTRWNDALTVAIWIFAFTRWVQYYLCQCAKTDSELDALSIGARELAMVRSMSEWRSVGVVTQSELSAFLDKAEELLSSDGGSKS